MNPPVVITDPELLAQLKAAKTVTDLRDPDGKIIAAFVPRHLRRTGPPEGEPPAAGDGPAESPPEPAG